MTCLRVCTHPIKPHLKRVIKIGHSRSHEFIYMRSAQSMIVSTLRVPPFLRIIADQSPSLSLKIKLSPMQSVQANNADSYLAQSPDGNQGLNQVCMRRPAGISFSSTSFPPFYSRANHYLHNQRRPFSRFLSIIAMASPITLTVSIMTLDQDLFRRLLLKLDYENWTEVVKRTEQQFVCLCMYTLISNCFLCTLPYFAYRMRYFLIDFVFTL